MRRTLWLGAALILIGVGAASAAQLVRYQSLTVSTSAVGFSATTLGSGADQIGTCEARLEGAQIRYRFDGTAPTAGEGVVLEVGDVIVIQSHEDASRIRFIRTGAADGTLKAHCWRNGPGR